MANILFTPWRYSYLTAARTPGCFFCDALAAAETPQESLLLCVGRHNIVMMNRYPYTNGHLMIAPAAHIATPLAAGDEVLAEMMTLTREAQRILEETYRPDGFNIGMNVGRAAGAGIDDHCHMHIVPRWSGDTNFMTVYAETRMVPEPLGETHRRLLPQFAALAQRSGGAH